MPSAAPSPDPWSPPPYDPVAQIVALAEQVSRMLAIAGALAASRRRVDLDGLQNNVGLLCARALDLPPQEAGLARAEMIRLVAGLDALTATMRGQRI
jgi:hypothetical protein